MQNLVKMTSKRATKGEIDTLIKFLAKRIVEAENYQAEFGQENDDYWEIDTYLLLKKLQKSVTKIILKTPQHTNTYFQFLTVFLSANFMIDNAPEKIDLQNMLFQQVDNTFIERCELKMNPIF